MLPYLVPLPPSSTVHKRPEVRGGFSSTGYCTTIKGLAFGAALFRPRVAGCRGELQAPHVTCHRLFSFLGMASLLPLP